MFLDVTKRRNPDLIKTGVNFHQSGKIPPNTYIIDVDLLRENTKKLVETAEKHQFELYFMLKQLGRLPEIAKIISESGINKAVAVDFDEGKILADHHINIGNIGHLVQPGKNQWEEVLSWHPEVVTIFSYERAEQLSRAAKKTGVNQDVLLKVLGPHDKIYQAQEGGIPIDAFSDTVDRILELENVTIVGVTSFPNLEIDHDKKQMIPTNNMSTLLQGRDILKQKGIPLKQINGPSGTSSETIPFLAEQGITHGEPGHGLTGTTPLHALKDLPEKPAIIYVSEVSHQYKDYYQVIAGGFYGRSNMEYCLVGHDEASILNRQVHAYQNKPDAIDYYGLIDQAEDFIIHIGDTAVFAFRTQLFVTRSHIALVEGIQSGTPRMIHLERKW